MNNYPEYAEISGRRFKINTDFRVAIQCNQIAQDETIGKYERALAIIYKLFGKEGLEAYEYHNQLLIMAKDYLACGQELKKDIDENPDMDYVEDYSYIKTSFRSDYGMNIDNEKLHWWEFYDLLNGLSNSELGNSCILNRVRNLRNIDLSKIEDSKERQRIKEAQDIVALKKYKKENNLTKEQEKSMEELNKLLGL